MNELFSSDQLSQSFVIKTTEQGKPQNSRFPYVDLSGSFVIGPELGGEILDMYRHACRLQAGVFAICLQGSMDVSINGEFQTVEKNNFIAIVPGSIIQCHKRSEDLRLCFAAFASSVMESVNLQKSSMDFITQMQEKPILPLKEQTAEWFRDYFNLLGRAANFVMGRMHPEIVKNILQSVLYGIGFLYRNRQWDQQVLSRGEEIYRDLLRTARQYYRHEHALSFYANKLNLSPQHLSMMVKQVCGQTVSDVIADMVIMDAKAQLRSSATPIQEIADSLGFANISIFGKYFKRYVGVSPRKYREEMEKD